MDSKPPCWPRCGPFPTSTASCDDSDLVTSSLSREMADNTGWNDSLNSVCGTNTYSSAEFGVASDQQQLPTSMGSFGDIHLFDHQAMFPSSSSHITGHPACAWPAPNLMAPRPRPTASSQYFLESGNDHSFLEGTNNGPQYDFTTRTAEPFMTGMYSMPPHYSNHSSPLMPPLRGRSDDPWDSTERDIFADHDGSESVDTAEVAEPCYARLLYSCLMGAPDNTLSLKDLYEWVRQHTQKAKDPKNKGWQNSVRHNLSMNAVRVAGSHVLTIALSH